MKISVGSFVLTAAALVSAHYTFPDFIMNGQPTSDWQYVRETANHYSNGPVTDVTDEALRCYELDYSATAPATSVATVQAGSTVGFQANGPIYHPGYLAVYMSPATPAANSPNAGTGNTWFKVWQKLPTVDGSTLTSDTTDSTFTFTIPKNLPSGPYLIRGEQIALHVASTFGGAQFAILKLPQFYIGCAQVNVTNGGSGTPGPLVSIPGVYTGNEPGILINIYDLPSGFVYQPPGPTVWSG
ncbi:lytic polysaccharide monooxygenase [Sphaerobolus stellatus SS14]|uniref:lytic cellulose monooxygenase (C4-dehydrogenating) n=1 Tax=Sphaerobolus stellatus (strain SS14) TaxID=990650 RepID=A0A0C9V471_SPHS4|nr:lytic polysaccharide monooxygenase [Sphaerobolus stellatus SS14]